MRPPPFWAAHHAAGRLSRGLAVVLLAGILTAAADGAGAVAGNVPDGAPGYPPRSVLLLVAPWCAPCHAEVARLDALAAAATPLSVRVLLVDQGARARAMVRDVPSAQRWEPPADAWRRARADLMARTPGLPFSVVTDGQGRICAATGGGLTPERVRALIRRCED